MEGALEKEVGEERFAAWSLLGKWLQGEGVQETGGSPARALFLIKVIRSVQVTAAQGCMRMERAQFLVQLSTVVRPLHKAHSTPNPLQ